MRWVVLVVTGCGRLGFAPAGDGGPSEDGACTDACALEPARVDDSFDRPDGPIGPAWSATPGSFAIVNGELEASGYGAAMFSAGPVTGDAWAQITLSQPNPEQEYGIVLAARGASPTDDRLHVAYHPEIGNSHVHLATVLGEQTSYITDVGADFPSGTRMRALLRGGMIEVYFDETLHVTFPTTAWPYSDLDGNIGVFASYNFTSARLDDFGGGPCGCP